MFKQLGKEIRWGLIQPSCAEIRSWASVQCYYTAILSGFLEWWGREALHAQYAR